MSDQELRQFVLVEGGKETSTKFSGRFPRKAAIKAARQLDVDNVSENNPEEIRLREVGTSKIHVFQGWAWEEETNEDSPDWLGDVVVEANVSKDGMYVLD